ncbi:MAG: PDZ domain-containing protein [Evtepia gabavorous]
MSRTKIQSVAPGTPAHQAGVRPGETLLAINGHPIVDVLDYNTMPTTPSWSSSSGRRRGSGRWSCPRTWGRTWG